MAGGNNDAVRPVAVFGGRRVAPMILRRIEAAGGGLRFAGLLNDTVVPGETIDGDIVLGPFTAWRELPGDTRFIAPLHKIRETAQRAALMRRLGVPEARWATAIDPQAMVAPGVAVGPGGLIAPFAVVMPAVRLGRHVAVRQGASIGHDVEAGDWCMFAANCAIGGDVRVGTGGYIGMGATVRERISVGRWSVVGMGAVVVHDVPDFAIVAGNPARIIGEVPPIEGCE
jgi:sugar O-acyltransferase (sialic acid O-acetyltransferase NeuD family)